MEQTGQRERVSVLDHTRSVMANSTVAGAGMVAFLVALALLFVVSGPA